MSLADCRPSAPSCLPDSAIKESRDRVTAAIKNSGFYFPQTRITANLAPRGHPKKRARRLTFPSQSVLWQLPIRLDPTRLENALILGELALNGNIRGIQGGLPIAIAAKENGIEALILTAENAKEAANCGRRERLSG